VELLQAYFLIHDDWMDRDRVRRGGPAVHAALEPHVASEHLAASGAVLAGDYTLALGTRVLASAGPPNGKWPALLRGFAQMQLDAVVGQKLDVLGDGNNLDEVCRLKTASYTVLGPLKLGLVLAGADQPENAAMEGFAVPLGIAFQLRDDLIGAFGDTTVTGKPQGSDLRAGKRTLLVNLALELAGTADARRIQCVLGSPTASPEALAAALASIDACGARARVEQRIQALAAEARGALSAGGFQPAARALLEGVQVALLERTH
jgi:geranylgeranyl diphosphate synthase type I